jgi:undecaprenyl diphosphate synthase
VAIIMDGNGRWAQKRGLPRSAGHVAGVNAVRRIVKASAERGLECLTLFAFSTENWARPADEVSILMRLFMMVLGREVNKLHRQGVRLRLIGDCSRFTPDLQKRIREAEDLTAANTGMTLCVAANYGARWDITQAVQRVMAANPGAQNFSQQDIEAGLSTADLPPLDLLIRTGGEKRLSNFLLWQAADARLFFTDIWWPDFNAQVLEQAMACCRTEPKIGLKAEIPEQSVVA